MHDSIQKHSLMCSFLIILSLWCHLSCINSKKPKFLLFMVCFIKYKFITSIFQIIMYANIPKYIKWFIFSFILLDIGKKFAGKLQHN